MDKDVKNLSYGKKTAGVGDEHLSPPPNYCELSIVVGIPRLEI